MINAACYPKAMLLAALAAALLTLSDPLAADDAGAEAPRAVTLPAVTLGAAVAATLHFDVAPGFKVNAKAPRRLRVGERKVRIAPGPTPVTFTVTPADTQTDHLWVDTEYYVCRPAPDAPCYLRAVRFDVPLRPGKDAVRHLELRTPP